MFVWWHANPGTYNGTVGHVIWGRSQVTYRYTMSGGSVRIENELSRRYLMDQSLSNFRVHGQECMDSATDPQCIHSRSPPTCSRIWRKYVACIKCILISFQSLFLLACRVFDQKKKVACAESKCIHTDVVVDGCRSVWMERQVQR